jgi:hypothetical protein
LIVSKDTMLFGWEALIWHEKRQGWEPKKGREDVYFGIRHQENIQSVQLTIGSTILPCRSYRDPITGAIVWRPVDGYIHTERLAYYSLTWKVQFFDEDGDKSVVLGFFVLSEETENREDWLLEMNEHCPLKELRSLEKCQLAIRCAPSAQDKRTVYLHELYESTGMFEMLQWAGLGTIER